MRQNVLLIKPFGAADEIIPPLSLGWLAAQIRGRHDVRILDALKEQVDADAIAGRVASERTDIAGFQVWSKDVHEVKRICQKIKAARPSCRTIAGGIHPTMDPEGTLDFMGEALDFAFQGEGEIGFAMLADALASGNATDEALARVPGLAWRGNSGVRTNKNTFLEDLDAVGLPAWDLIAPDSYPESPHGAFYRNFPIAPIVVTRGCPFPCTFCSASAASGNKLRFRSIDSVIEELTLLKRSFGVKEFQIEDDNFTFNRRYVETFCERLLSLDFKFTWSFPNGIRLDTVDPPLLQLMKKAGCYSLNFGIESGSERMLRLIKKKITLERIREQLEMAHEAGFSTGGFFIMGLPGETEDEIRQTIRFACSLPLDRAGISYFQPFPGTDLYHELLSAGEITEDWAYRHHTSLHDLTYITKTLTAEKLHTLRRKFLRDFYLRPRTVFVMLRQIRSPRHFYFMLKRSIRWLKA